MAGLVEWHDDHARNAKRVRFRSAIPRRRLREWLRRIPCRYQRPVLVPPANEEILVAPAETVIASSRGIAARPSALRKIVGSLAPRYSSGEHRPPACSSRQLAANRARC